jgi:hypothetical protein
MSVEKSRCPGAGAKQGGLAVYDGCGLVMPSSRGKAPVMWLSVELSPVSGPALLLGNGFRRSSGLMGDVHARERIICGA